MSKNENEVATHNTTYQHVNRISSPPSLCRSNSELTRLGLSSPTVNNDGAIPSFCPPNSAGDSPSRDEESNSDNETNESDAISARFRRRKLKWTQLCMMAFLYTCVGPAALEPIIQSSGSTLVVVLGCVIVPLFYAVPQIVLVSELGAMLPSNHGLVLWVYEAFGDALGFYTALNFVVTNIIDVATYPTLAGNFLIAVIYGTGVFTGTTAGGNTTSADNSSITPVTEPNGPSPELICSESHVRRGESCTPGGARNEEDTTTTIFGKDEEDQKKDLVIREEPPFWVVYTARAGFVLLGAALSLLPANLVAHAQTVIAVIMVVPFVVGVAHALPDINPKEQWGLPQSIDNIHFGSTLSGFLWLYTGWTSLGSLAGEVERPSTLTKGMFSALGLDILVYLFPLMAALSISSNPEEWEDGHFVRVWGEIYPWLGPFLGITVALTSMGCYMTAVSCYARTLWGMAEMGMAPRVFLVSNKTTGVPVVALAAHVIGALALVAIDLTDIVTAEFIIASTAYILGFASFYQLRRTHPNAPRPFKPPGHPIIYIFGQSCIMLAVAVLGVMDDWRMGVATLVANLMILGAYFVYRSNRGEGTKSGLEALRAVDTAATAAENEEEEEKTHRDVINSKVDHDGRDDDDVGKSPTDSPRLSQSVDITDTAENSINA